MSDDFVNRQEFNSLKEEVRELKEEVSEYKQLLQQIDKKCDVITERISNANKIDELKLEPLTMRVQKLEDNLGWLAKTVAGAIIAFVIKVIFEISKTIS